MRPANTVGGDYFDVIDLGGARLAIAIGDVAGKGMPAALLMALLQGSLRTLLSAPASAARSSSPSSTRTCARTSPRTGSSRSSTAELDPATVACATSTAGHNPPFLLSRGSAPRGSTATAIALGITMETAFESMSLDLEPGDRLVLYTDGVTEAENPPDQEFGEARLCGWLEANRDEPGRARSTA